MTIKCRKMRKTQPIHRDTNTRGILRQEAETTSKGRADMCQHAEQNNGVKDVQGQNQEPRCDPKKGLPEMAQPNQQAVVGMQQYTVELQDTDRFQDELLRRARCRIGLANQKPHCGCTEMPNQKGEQDLCSRGLECNLRERKDPSAPGERGDRASKSTTHRMNPSRGTEPAKRRENPSGGAGPIWQGGELQPQVHMRARGHTESCGAKPRVTITPMPMGREGKSAKQVSEDGQRQTHKTTHEPTNRESRNVTNRTERQTEKGQVKQEMQPRQIERGSCSM